MDVNTEFKNTCIIQLLHFILDYMYTVTDELNGSLLLFFKISVYKNEI